MENPFTTARRQTVFLEFVELVKTVEEYNNRKAYRCEQVRKLLLVKQRRTCFAIQSTFFGAPVADSYRQNSIQGPDFYIVVKVNSEACSCQEMLKFWAQTLLKNARKVNISTESIVQTAHSILFRFTTDENNVPVELFPVKLNETPAQTLRTVGRNPTTIRFYHSSLVESPEGLVSTENDELIRDISRLAQYWLKSMDLEGNELKHGSKIFDCLALAAVNQASEDPPDANYFTNAFCTVVNFVKNIRTLTVGWYRARSGNWEQEVQRQRVPYVMDYSNRRNNLLLGVSPEMLQILERNGRVMWTRYQVWRKGNALYPDILFESTPDF